MYIICIYIYIKRERERERERETRETDRFNRGDTRSLTNGSHVADGS